MVVFSLDSSTHIYLIPSLFSVVLCYVWYLAMVHSLYQIFPMIAIQNDDY